MLAERIHRGWNYAPELPPNCLYIHRTGSAGNAISYFRDGVHLLLDAGVSFREVARAAGAPDYVFVTHQHADHAGYLETYTRLGVTAVAPFEAPGVEVLQPGKLLDIYAYTTSAGAGFVAVQPLKHNVPCVGYIWANAGEGALVYMTDTSELHEIHIDVRTAVIGCAYTPWGLSTAEFNSRAHYQHVVNDHLGFDRVIDFVADHPELEHLVITHTGAAFCREEANEMLESTGFSGKFYIAESGDLIRL